MATLTSSLSAVSAILNHDRASTSWVARVGADGKIERIARIVYVWPRDGAGTMKCAVTDWGKRTPTGEPTHYVAKAGGFGYDKAAQALAGATIGGVVLGDHCDPNGGQTLQDTCRANGWELFVG